jgi:hypothetical protein
MTEPKEFKCPKCGGQHFGSDVELDEQGNAKVRDMVTCQSVIKHKYIGPYTAHTYCGWRGTREEAGL